MRQIHRVEGKRGPKAPVPPLPRDEWHGPVFVTAEGDWLESIWSGYGPLPTERPWPVGREKLAPLPVKIPLKRGWS